jgi:hypothetical protein
MDEEYIDELARENGITREEVIAWLQNDTRDTALKAFSAARTGVPPAGEAATENPHAVPRPPRGPKLDATLGGQRPVFTPPEPERPHNPNYTERWIENPTTNYLMKNGINPQWAGYAGLGAGIGAGFTPGLGTGLSGLDAVHAYNEGDYGDMILNGVGLIPFAGGAIKGGKAAWKVLRNPSVRESAERIAREAGDAGRVVREGDDVAGDLSNAANRGNVDTYASRADTYLPPRVPRRNFREDYPNGARADASGRLLEDIDGRSLGAKYIAGRDRLGGPDRSFPANKIDAAITHLLGDRPRSMPEDKLRSKNRPPKGEEWRPTEHAHYNVTEYDDGTVRRRIRNQTGYSPLETRNLRQHELSHEIYRRTGDIPTDGVLDELHRVYDELLKGKKNPDGPWQGPSPKDYTSEQMPHELWSEAIRAYLSDPNYFKTVAPNAAARLRSFVNENPQLKGYIQLNSVAPWLAPINTGEQDIETG